MLGWWLLATEPAAAGSPTDADFAAVGVEVAGGPVLGGQAERQDVRNAAKLVRSRKDAAAPPATAAGSVANSHQPNIV